MKRLVLSTAALALAFTLPAGAQQKGPTTLKGILLDQLRSTHSKSDWFVCSNVAVANLTPEQANWTDGKGNHSVGQLTYHLLFWDRRELARLSGKPMPEFKGDNSETFDKFDGKTWPETVRQLDQVLTDMEKLVEAAPDAKVAEIGDAIAHVSAHNAYHIGEIVMVRKEQGVWDASKGVK